MVRGRRLYRFLETEGQVSASPLPSLHLTPGPRKLPQVLSSDDLRRLLAQPDATTPLGSRDQAMLELMYAAGLRVSELVSLQTQQIDFQGNYLTVKGKGIKGGGGAFGKMGARKAV